jgi:pyrroloquinoline quinone (PQQ) biosynthesis protein C
LRDRVHLILLEEGLLTGAQLGEALDERVRDGTPGDVVSVLIHSGVLSRGDVAAVMERNTRESKDLTHPALFRRFLHALGLDTPELSRLEPIAATEDFNATYRTLCRDGHWLEGLAAMGPGTECIVPSMYGRILEGIRRSGAVSAADYVFWTIHVHCDDGHGRNIIEALQPYASDPGQQHLIWRGTMRALDARQRWFDALLGHVFGEATPAARHSITRDRVPYERPISFAPTGSAS